VKKEGNRILQKTMRRLGLRKIWNKMGRKITKGFLMGMATQYMAML
jgi:hypothetical protein